MCSARPNDDVFQYLTPVRSNVPSVEYYANKVRMTELDLEMADTEEEKRELQDRKSSYTWRGLRLASKNQLSLFDKIEPGKGLEVFLPVTSSIEATGDDSAPNASDDKGSAPQDEHQSVEELRAGQQVK